MKTVKKIVLSGLLALVTCAHPAQAQELYKNEKATTHERVTDLLSRLTVFSQAIICRYPFAEGCFHRSESKMIVLYLIMTGFGLFVPINSFTMRPERSKW